MIQQSGFFHPTLAINGNPYGQVLFPFFVNYGPMAAPRVWGFQDVEDQGGLLTALGVAGQINSFYVQLQDAYGNNRTVDDGRIEFQLLDPAGNPEEGEYRLVQVAGTALNPNGLYEVRLQVNNAARYRLLLGVELSTCADSCVNFLETEHTGSWDRRQLAGGFIDNSEPGMLNVRQECDAHRTWTTILIVIVVVGVVAVLGTIGAIIGCLVCCGCIKRKKAMSV